MTVRRLAEIQPASFAFTPENEAWAQKEIAKYPPGRQASAVLPLLWRAQEQNDYWLPKPAIEKRRGDARHAADARARSRDLLLDVQSVAGRAPSRAALRHDAMHVARRETIKKVCRAADRRRASCHRRRRVLLDRGRMPRRLLQCADGADQRRLLRGPDAGEFREAARRSRRRAAGRQDGSQTGRARLGAGRRPDFADDALRRRRSQRPTRGAPRHDDERQT